MAMTRAELRTEVRSIVAEKEEGYWTNEEINRWINQGATDFARKTHVLVDTDSITLEATTSAYDFPTGVIDPKGVVVNDDPLEFVSEKALDNDDSDWRDNTGIPTKFFVRGQEIVFEPQPTDGDTDKTCILTSAQTPTDMDADATECGLPEMYHSVVPLFAAWRAFIKDENFDAADRIKAEYDKEVAQAKIDGYTRLWKGTPMIKKLQGVGV